MELGVEAFFDGDGFEVGFPHLLEKLFVGIHQLLAEQAGKQMSLKNAGQWYATMPENQLANMLRSDPTLAADWDEVYGDRMQKLVFIGQNLDKAYIKKELDACLVD